MGCISDADHKKKKKHNKEIDCQSSFLAFAPVGPKYINEETSILLPIGTRPLPFILRLYEGRRGPGYIRGSKIPETRIAMHFNDDIEERVNSKDTTGWKKTSR